MRVVKPALAPDAADTVFGEIAVIKCDRRFCTFPQMLGIVPVTTRNVERQERITVMYRLLPFRFRQGYSLLHSPADRINRMSDKSIVRVGTYRMEHIGIRYTGNTVVLSVRPSDDDIIFIGQKRDHRSVFLVTENRNPVIKPMRRKVKPSELQKCAGKESRLPLKTDMRIAGFGIPTHNRGQHPLHSRHKYRIVNAACAIPFR